MAVEIRKISSGDEGIDSAHKEFVELAAAMDASCDIGDYGAISDDDMQRLLGLANTMFDLEKAAMEELSYHKAPDHIEEHEILISTIEVAIGKVKSKSVALIKDSVGIMLFSLAGHIETMDVPLADQISKKIRKPAMPTRRSSDGAGPSWASPGPAAGRRGGGAPPPSAKSMTGDDGANLKTIIVNTYSSALLDLKARKGITGDRAKDVAYEIVARAVNKAVGKKISAEFVKQIIISQ